MDVELRGEVACTRRDLRRRPSSVVVDQVHLVDGDDEVRDAEQRGDEGVAAGLLDARPCGRRRGSIARSAVEAPVTMLRVYWTWPGRVGDDELAPRGGEVAVGDVDRDALLPLGAQAVGEQREVDVARRRAARLSRARRLRAGPRRWPSCRRAAARSGSTCRRRFLEKILSNARKITYMIDRLALSVKLENNDFTIHPIAFNLADLVQDVTLNLSKKYREREIFFTGEECMIYADKEMLDNVLTNLIDNALKYSEDDVTVSITNGTLMVIDKGMGISESDLDKVSSKFYRVNKNTWDNSLGLGLAIVGYILKLHHSELIIESKVGEGSRFGFSLKSMLREA